MTDIIRIEGDERIRQAIKKAPREIATAIKAAGQEASNEILNTQGLRRYPPATSANLPPTPYYVRGRGMQYKSRNDGRSERYGTKWTTRTRGSGTVIGNSASYARYLAGEEQSAKMAEKGWRKLFEVAKEKMARITRIYDGWISRALQRAGLK